MRYYDAQQSSQNIHKLDIFKNVEREVSLDPEHAVKDMVYKEYNGSCEIMYEGERREGIILSMSSNGSLVVGLLKKGC